MGGANPVFANLAQTSVLACLGQAFQMRKVSFVTFVIAQWCSHVKLTVQLFWITCFLLLLVILKHKEAI